jgi:Tfp pilus assembly protein PilN
VTYKLNLASQPFRNRTLPWTVSIVVAAISLLVIVYVFSETSRIRAEADVAERQVVELRRQKLELEEQAKRIQEEIPLDQRQTLKAAHEIVDRKKFSWSQLFADLEESLPSTVRVARINVREVAQRGEQMTAQLDLSVVGRTPTDVTGMITEMSRAGFFSAVPLSETVKNEKGEGGYEWSLRVSYVQRPRQGKIEASPSNTEVSASGLGSSSDGREAGSR